MRDVGLLNLYAFGHLFLGADYGALSYFRDRNTDPVNFELITVK